MKSFRQIFCFSALLCAGSHAAPATLSQIHASLQKIDPSIKPAHYDLARADLDADGKEDVLALLNGNSSAGSPNGSTLFILKGNGKGLTNLDSVKGVQAPVYLGTSVTNGYRNLIVTVREEGVTPRLASLSFDRENYSSNAGEANAALKDDEVIFPEPIPPFDQTAILQGISFRVTSPSLKAGNTITITPGGLVSDNKPVTVEIIGTVSRIETGDIDADGSPEIYIYTTDGDGTSLLAYSVNQRKSLSQIFLPALDGEDENAHGYRGHDEFAIVENSLARRFPVYPDEPGDMHPTGKTRQLQYQLQHGEAGWLLKVGKAAEF
jgi:hypothetical protein